MQASSTTRLPIDLRPANDPTIERQLASRLALLAVLSFALYTLYRSATVPSVCDQLRMKPGDCRNGIWYLRVQGGLVRTHCTCASQT